MMTLRQLSARFQTQEQCLAYLVSMRWPDGVYCPRCGNDHVYALKQPFKWQCKKCAPNGYRFSPLTGTIFENTKFPLRDWLQVILMVCQAKKGLSALQVQRHIGMGQYRTAGAIARKGNVVCQVIEATDAKTLDGFVDSTVADRVSMVATDEHQGYRRIGSKRPHGTVDHSAGEYVRGEIHTANIDSFWSLIKRGIFGNFHHVSKKYLPLYLNEFSFRHNNRENPDMFSTVVAGS
jgi:transposase-like protein